MTPDEVIVFWLCSIAVIYPLLLLVLRGVVPGLIAWARARRARRALPEISWDVWGYVARDGRVLVRAVAPVGGTVRLVPPAEIQWPGGRWRVRTGGLP